MGTRIYWPIRAFLDGRRPVVSSGFAEVRKANADHPEYKHNGLDLGYRANNAVDPAYPGHYTANRTKLFYSPDAGVACAYADGVVVQAAVKRVIQGDVWVHHEELGIVTEYAHLSAVHVKVGDRVVGGQPVGVIGASSNTPWIHLHFARLRAGVRGSYHDPLPGLRGATLLGWSGEDLGPYNGSGGSAPPSKGGGTGALVAGLALALSARALLG